MNIGPVLADLLNKVEPGQQIITHGVPLRIFRVTAIDESFRTFRVEQLVMHNRDPHNPRGFWKALTTHGGAGPWDSYTDAFAAMCKAQTHLKAKLTKIQRERQQSMRIIRP